MAKERTSGAFDIINDKERARAHAEEVRKVQIEGTNTNTVKPEAPKEPVAVSTETPGEATPSASEQVETVTEPLAETETVTEASDEVIEVTEDKVIRVGDEEIPVKELLGQRNLISRKDRKIAKLQAQVTQAPKSERLQEINRLIQSGVSEDEAILRTAQTLEKPVPAQVDTEPKRREGFEPGDPEYAEDTMNIALWKQKQEFKSELAPVLGFVNQVSQNNKAQQEDQVRRTQTVEQNNAYLAEYTEYAPFEYNALPEEKKAEFNQRVVAAAANRGLIISGQNANIDQVAINPQFVELCVNDASQGFSLATTTPAPRKPLVPSPQPKSPLVPLPSSAPVLTPPNRERKRSGGYSIEGAIKAKTG